MKLLWSILSVFLPAICAAGWIDASGRPVPDRENMRSAGDFGVQLILTPNEADFRRTWSVSSSTPSLRKTDRVRRGASVSAMLIFHGCTKGATGKCDVVAEFALLGPDGKRMPAGSGTAWNAEPVPGKLLLANSSVTIGFDRSDPVGTYMVNVVVTDRVAGRSLPLSSPVHVE